MTQTAENKENTKARRRMFPFDLFCNFSHSEKSYKFNFLPSVSPPASILSFIQTNSIYSSFVFADFFRRRC